MLYTLYSMLNKAHEQGGRNNGIARRMPLWKECADYFPMALHKTVDLQPGKPYVFGYHPHGVIGLGVVISIASDALGVKKLFPGVSIHPGTLDINFQVPISRDVLLSLGFVSCNESALDAVLDNGDSVLLAVGGAAESMNAAPGTNRLTLDSRMGFVRLALKHGAGLVPIFGFGESDIFEQVDNHEGTWVRWFQETFKDVTTFSPLLPYGRYGILPYRRPITVVVGAPIDVPKIQNPTEFEVRKYHRQYVDALKRLYHSHKNELLPHRKSDLVIVDEVTAKL
ncbi:diacylglycerol acyltransferase [Chytriomyces sp. MP71]|nr:diacylglycerol acyltransferase [Chytriomyces sp. MP71]